MDKKFWSENVKERDQVDRDLDVRTKSKYIHTHTQRPIYVWGGGVCSCGLGLSGFEQGSLEDGSEVSGTCH
jgi:hypothetical protein